MDKKYMDIINLDYKPSLKHPRMPRQNRACQFQAFKALRGYEERIYESSKEKIKKTSSKRPKRFNKLPPIGDNIWKN